MACGCSRRSGGLRRAIARGRSLAGCAARADGALPDGADRDLRRCVEVSECAGGCDAGAAGGCGDAGSASAPPGSDESAAAGRGAVKPVEPLHSLRYRISRCCISLYPEQFGCFEDGKDRKGPLGVQLTRAVRAIVVVERSAIRKYREKLRQRFAVSRYSDRILSALAWAQRCFRWSFP